MPSNPVTNPEHSESISELHHRTLPVRSVVDPAEEVQHAYWAEFDEDNTTPDDEELKEIEGSDADRSACERRFPV